MGYYVHDIDEDGMEDNDDARGACHDTRAATPHLPRRSAHGCSTRIRALSSWLRLYIDRMLSFIYLPALTARHLFRDLSSLDLLVVFGKQWRSELILGGIYRCFLLRMLQTTIGRAIISLV